MPKSNVDLDRKQPRVRSFCGLSGFERTPVVDKTMLDSDSIHILSQDAT